MSNRVTIKYQLIKVSLMVATMTIAPSISPFIHAEENSEAKSGTFNAPTLIQTIDLKKYAKYPDAVRKISYSPNGRYIAVAFNPDYGKTDIIVWDLEIDKEQSIIHCDFDYGALISHWILWNADATVISFGARKQWDPMSGKPLQDNPAVGRSARLNKDRTEMLTVVDFPEAKTELHVYNTKTWALKNISVDNLMIETAAWTADDKILLGVKLGQGAKSEYDGYKITNNQDVGLRLIDPSGITQPKGVWFSAIKSNIPNTLPWMQSISVDLSVTNFIKNQVALGANRIVNVNNLSIITYYSKEELENGSRAGGGGYAFSADGKYLFVKDAKWFDNRKPVTNAVIDSITGKHITLFPGGDSEIAANPNGKTIAMGNRNSVLIYKL